MSNGTIILPLLVLAGLITGAVWAYSAYGWKGLLLFAIFVLMAIDVGSDDPLGTYI